MTLKRRLKYYASIIMFRKVASSARVNLQEGGKSLKQPRWSKWTSLKTLDFSSIPSSSGVYQIRWAIDGKPQVIHRANGDDNSGLLYIGKSKTLRSRIGVFWKDVINKTEVHTAGYTYFYYSYEKKFKPEQLGVRWSPLPEDEFDSWEDELLEDYAGKYLESPPLNIRLPRH